MKSKHILCTREYKIQDNVIQRKNNLNEFTDLEFTSNRVINYKRSVAKYNEPAKGILMMKRCLKMLYILH